jgi:hypothetical protein
VAERKLVALTRHADAVSADALVALLAAHEIEAHVEGADPLALPLGGRIRVVIAEEDLARAQRLLAEAEREAGER